MAQPLGFCQIGLPPLQLLCQMFLFGHIHTGADNFLEGFAVNNRNTDAPNITDVPVWPNNPLLDVAPYVFGHHAFNELRHELTVIRVNKCQTLCERGGFALPDRDRRFRTIRETNT